MNLTTLFDKKEKKMSPDKKFKNMIYLKNFFHIKRYQQN